MRDVTNNAERIFGDKAEQAKFFRRLMRSMKEAPTAFSSKEHLVSAQKHHTEESFPFSVEKLAPYAESSQTVRELLIGRFSALRGEDALGRGEVTTAIRAYAAAYRTGSFLVRWESSTIALAVSSFTDVGFDVSKEKSLRSDALMLLSILGCMVQGVTPSTFDMLTKAQLLCPDDGSLCAIAGSIFAISMKKRAA